MPRVGGDGQRWPLDFRAVAGWVARIQQDGVDIGRTRGKVRSLQRDERVGTHASDRYDTSGVAVRADSTAGDREGDGDKHQHVDAVIIGDI